MEDLNKKEGFSRRGFLKTAAAVGAALAVSPIDIRIGHWAKYRLPPTWLPEAREHFCRRVETVGRCRCSHSRDGRPLQCRTTETSGILKLKIPCQPFRLQGSSELLIPCAVWIGAFWLMSQFLYAVSVPFSLHY